MALHNPAGLYQGQAPLNPLPYVNIALQARQRKQLRDDAIDKYYKQLPDTINDKGVRDQEIPIINESKNKIFEFGAKNKEALRNPKLDNGAAQFTLQKMIRDTHGIARLSQDAAKDDLEIGKMRFMKGNEWLADDEEFIKEHDLHNLPVTDPNFKKVDINKVLQGRPFDLPKKIKNYADIKMGEGTPEVTPHPSDPLLQIVKTKPVFDEQTKQTIYARAVNDFHNDRQFQKQISKLTLPEIQELDTISKETFGHPIREDFADEDAAAAFIVRALAPKPTVQKVRQNTGEVMDKRRKEGMEDWLKKNALTYQQSLAKIRLNNQNRKEGLPTEEMGYVSDEVGDEVGVSETVNLGGKERDVRIIYTDQVDPERLDIITGRDLTKKKLGVKPIQIKQKDGTYKFGYYQDPGTGDWEGAEGQKISREAVKDRYIQSKAGTKFKAQTGTKGSENTKNNLSREKKDWTKEGKYWKYKDGSLYDDAGNKIK